MKKNSLISNKYYIEYIEDLNRVFANICHDKKNTILLESAEVDTKDKLKSILVIDSAIKVSCIGNTVILKSLSKNGEYAFKKIYSNIQETINCDYKNNILTLYFPNLDNHDHDDEYTKLKKISIFDSLRIIKDSFEIENEFSIFLAGLFAYDVVASFENIAELERKNKCPDFVFYLAENILITDHQTHKSYLQTNIFDKSVKEDFEKRIKEIKNTINTDKKLEIEKTDLDIKVSMDDKQFCKIVSDLKSNIINGDIFQVVPSRSFYLPCQNSLEVYKELKRTNPSPYMFYMQDDDFILFGASPESALKYHKDTNQVEIYPIAGTRRRGKNFDGSINNDLDSRIELELRSDIKENAEHMMLVDLARNDVARISKTGTRYLADLLKVDRYSHVMHLVSRVVGQLRDDLDALHAYQACMNMGTLTGAPKIKAMQLIANVEKQTRGSYGGAVGYFNGNGDLDTCIVIRSAYVENDIAEIQAGAGVVLDSIPIAEADETRTKAQAVISAIKNIHGNNNE